MSTIKVNKIENTSTTNGGVSIDNDGHVTIDGQQLPTAGPLSNRNLIINGAMQVAQRSTSETGLTSGGYHTIDRFRISQVSNGAGTFRLDQSTDVPANQGFVSSFKIESTTPSGNPYPTADAVFLDQRIEAQDLQHLKYGTTSAEDVTVSFWAKASEGGTYCLSLHHDDPNKSYVKEYTLETGVWKYVSLTFSGNTADVITNDNGIGLIVAWGLAAGSDHHIAANAWTASPNTGGNVTTANQNQLFDTAGAEFYLTGVQLEVGSKSTPFEHESYSQTLAKCQRYYQKFNLGSYGSFAPIGRKGGAGYTEHDATCPFGPMRASPSGTWLGDLFGFRLIRLSDGATSTATAVTISGQNPNVFTFRGWTASFSTGTIIAQYSTGSPSNQSYELHSEL